ncbi:MAG: hypothetical protein ACI9OJ_000730 [Myxococcota bacterium]
MRIRYKGGDQDGEVIGEKLIGTSAKFENEVLELDEPVVGTQAFEADLLNTVGEQTLGIDGEPIVAEFTLIGDDESPFLVMNKQDVSSDDFKTIKVNHAVVPARFKLGVWVAVYEDDEGSPGTLRGKLKVLPGTHDDVVLVLTSKLKKGRLMHAMMRTGAAVSGSWSSTSDRYRPGRSGCPYAVFRRFRRLPPVARGRGSDAWTRW